MRAIKKPSDDPCAVLSVCIGSIEDISLKERLSELYPGYGKIASDYEILATDAKLSSLSVHVGNNDSVVLGSVTKGELKNLYTQQMVGERKPGRLIYERIRALSLGKLCPSCGFGQVKTLDHYLPKSKYPLYSVLPANLIPSCRDCNTGKLASSASIASSQPIHPYFDQQHFFDDQWIVASVVQTEPATLSFSVSPPDSWDPLSKARAAAHLESYDLSDRFSVRVGEQLAVLRHQLARFADPLSRSDHLREMAEDFKQVQKNSWQTAMHQALAASTWYCEVGFSKG